MSICFTCKTTLENNGIVFSLFILVCFFILQRVSDSDFLGAPPPQCSPYILTQPPPPHTHTHIHTHIYTYTHIHTDTHTHTHTHMHTHTHTHIHTDTDRQTHTHTRF